MIRRSLRWAMLLPGLAGVWAQSSGVETVFGLIQQGKLSAARMELDPLLRRSPQESMLLSADALLLSQSGDHEAAIRAAKGALAGNPRLDFARNLLALSLIAIGKRPEGIRELEALLAKSPDNAGTLRNLGLAHLQNGNAAKGMALLEKRLRLVPDDHLVRIDLVGSYLRMARRQDALRLEKRIPVDAELVEKLCTVLNEREEYALCAARLDSARAKGIDSPELAIVRAESLTGLGRLTEAQLILEAIPPARRGASYALTTAWLRSSKEDLPGAVRVLQETARSESANDRVFHALSLVFLRGGAGQDALDAAERGLEQWPDSAVLHFSAGMAREFFGRHQSAQEALRKSIALDPTNGLAHYVLALSEQIAGADWPKVSTSFRTALALRPGDALIASNYAREAARKEDWALAEKLARQAAASPEHAGAAHAVLGRAALARREFEAAAKHLESAMVMDPQGYAAAYRLGLEYMRRGEKEKARDYFAKYKEFKSAAEERDRERKVLLRLARIQ